MTFLSIISNVVLCVTILSLFIILIMLGIGIFTFSMLNEEAVYKIFNFAFGMFGLALTSFTLSGLILIADKVITNL